MGGNKLSDEQLKDGERKLKRYAKYVESMEADERANPQLLIDEAMKLGAHSLLHHYQDL